ncbi:MAG: extensin family protein [Pseudomonadota bacterium]
MRVRIIVTFLILCGILFGLHSIVPPQHNPYRALNLAQPIGLATRGQLIHLKRNPLLCRDVLTAAGIGFTEFDSATSQSRCTPEGTLVLERSATPYSAAPLRMSCHQLAALYIWETQRVRPQAEILFGSPLRQIQTYGTFSCRNIAGSTRLSEHASANAIDVYGFLLEDGREISVLRDWEADTVEGLFLDRIHRGACGLFSVTLGPNYNAAHADHFHLDMGRFTTCR